MLVVWAEFLALLPAKATLNTEKKEGQVCITLTYVTKSFILYQPFTSCPELRRWFW